MRAMFYSAAIFNWVMAVWFGFFVESLFGLLSITPVPTEPVMLQWFSIVVFGFGIGYFWIAQDMVKNRQIMLLGGVAKMLLVATGVLNVIFGMISWQVLLPLSIDFIYALLFFAVYRSTPGR